MIKIGCHSGYYDHIVVDRLQGGVAIVVMGDRVAVDEKETIVERAGPYPVEGVNENFGRAAAQR